MFIIIGKQILIYPVIPAVVIYHSYSCSHDQINSPSRAPGRKHSNTAAMTNGNVDQIQYAHAFAMTLMCLLFRLAGKNLYDKA